MTNLDYLYNPAAAQKFFNENYFIDKKLGFRVLENATVLPYKDMSPNGAWNWGGGGIVDSNGEFIKNSHVHFGIGKIYLPPPS